ncbi:MAG TPA: VTT domain-containing protein [Gaiellaceae bacterium]|nr:VTT domain-containing protein [Gaiellaceae bacterium]
MFDSLVDLLTHSEWAYVVVFAVAAIDAVFPAVPSEATVITAAALAASGRLSLAAVFVAGAGGALVGDNGAYALGRLSASWVRRLARWERAQAGMHWAEGELASRGGTIVLVSRFIPGGRTGTMLAAGVTGFRWRRFVLLDLVAAVFWAAYGTGLGALGGVAFAHRPLYAVGLALCLALCLAAALEGGRRLRKTRKGRGRSPDASPDEGA